MQKEIVSTKNAPAAIGKYSQAVVYNGVMYVSGQIAINPENGELEMDSIQQETERVMNNLKGILESKALGFEHILKCSIFLSDMNLFAEVNEIYAKYFDLNPPARECVAVKTLPKHVNVEISAIVAIN